MKPGFRFPATHKAGCGGAHSNTKEVLSQSRWRQEEQKFKVFLGYILVEFKASLGYTRRGGGMGKVRVRLKRAHPQPKFRLQQQQNSELVEWSALTGPAL